MKKYLLFDLDGTISDPSVGITKSVAYALNHLDIEVQDLTTLYPFIGPPLKTSFRDFFHLTDNQTEIAIKKYRERFSTTGIFENTIYPGMKELLENAGRTYKLMLATSKPEVYAGQILDHFGIANLFTFVGGAELNGNRQEKADVIKHVLTENDITDLDKVLMIGDREYDILGAKQNGIASLGVLYGFGSLEELTNAGANYIINDVNELNSFINS